MDFSNDINVEGYIVPLQRFISKIKPKKGMEIGFCWGASAYAYLSSCDGTLLSVDLSDHKRVSDKIKQEFGDRIEFAWADSKKYVPKLKEKFDYIYVDGEHWYEDAKIDIENSWPLVKKGGVMVCDDYNDYERDGGVKKALDEFAKKNDLKIRPIKDHANRASYIKK